MGALPHLGPYVLHRRIAKGGMAEVFLATKAHSRGKSDSQVVAIKAIRPDLADDPSFIRMFLDEARISLSLEHPNITRLLDFGEHQGSPFLVMEHVNGVSLRQAVKNGPIPAPLVFYIGSAVAQALHYAHGRKDEFGVPMGIVHRDVTPQNIMLTFTGGVKLLDFGIALARVRAERTATGILKGKWAYMSPEQLQAEPLDGRSDIFALGAVLYEMVTARRAFGGDSPSEILSGVALREPRPMSDFTDVPAELAEIIGRCLAKSKKNRFQTAEYLARALDGAASLADHVPDAVMLGEHVRGQFTTLRDQISTTRAAVAKVAASGPLDPLEAPTVIQAAPFEQLADDLDSTTRSVPPSFFSAPIAKQIPVEPAPSIEDPGVLGTWALPVAITIAVGTVIGVGIAVLSWYLSRAG